MPLYFLAVEIACSPSAIVSPGAALYWVECAVMKQLNTSTYATRKGSDDDNQVVKQGNWSVPRDTSGDNESRDKLWQMEALDHLNKFHWEVTYVLREGR